MPPIISHGSKLSIHSIEPGEAIPLLKAAAAKGITFPVVKSLNTGVMLDTRKLSPFSITVFRYVNPHDAVQGIERADFPYQRVVADTVAGILDRLRTPEERAAVDYIECFNEADPPGALAHANFAKLLVMVMEAWESTGIKARLMFPAFNAGTPEWNEMLAFGATGIFKTMFRLGHALSVHEGSLSNAPIQAGYEDDIPGVPLGQGKRLKAGSMALRYRHFHSLMAEWGGAFVPIFVSEWYDIHARDQGNVALVRSVAWYDEQVAQDPYVLGFAPFTIGATGSAGGWAWSDYTPQYPALIDYMVTVKNRQNAVSAQTPPVPETPSPVTPDPVVTGFKVGLHARADGHDQPQDFAVARTARIEAIKLLSLADPAVVTQYRQVRSDMLFMVRLFASFQGRRVLPVEFFTWVAPDFQKFYDQGIRLVEIHNEPNLRSEGLFQSWNTGTEFAAWFNEVARLMKARFPQVQVGFPGLSPGGSFEDGHEARLDDLTFLAQAQAAVAQADWVGVHVYWQNEAEFASIPGGQSYRQYLSRTTKPLYITEFSNSSTMPADLKGAQYVRFYTQLAAEPRVKAAFSFVVSAPSSFGRETWRDETGLANAIPQVVGARKPFTVPVPVPIPVPVPPLSGLQKVAGNWNQRATPDKAGRLQAVQLDGNTVQVEEISADGKWVLVSSKGWVSREAFK